MKLLHTKVWPELLTCLDAQLSTRGLAVERGDLGSGSGDALLSVYLPESDFVRAQEAGVRWVQVLTMGLERVMSPALVASWIPLTSVSGVAVGAMSEFVFSRMLEHAKSLRRLAELQADHRWESVALEQLEGRCLTIVGLGAIGRRVAELGHAFRMHVIGVRRRPEAGTAGCDEVVPPSSLAQVLPLTDYLVLAVPLSDRTRGIIGSSELNVVKPGCLLVNVGRGPLVDEAGLVEALTSGRLHAALDVFSEEPLPPESPLWDAATGISPHCSARTPSVFDEMAGVVADNIERFLANRPLRNLVDKAAGYRVDEG